MLSLTSKQYQGGAEKARTEAEYNVESDLTFQGLIGLCDPARVRSAGAFKECHQADISVHMLIGDQPYAALTITAQVGVIPSNVQPITLGVADAVVMTASSFDKISDDDIERLPALLMVMIRMIEALHRRGAFAAITEDSAEDSPSLKRAEVGIAMGLAESDIAEDAFDVVLTEDNLASILNAIEESRCIFDSI